MTVQYSPHLADIYNTLATHNLAQRHADMWFEKCGLEIYQDGKSHQDKADARTNGTDTYRIEIRNPDPAKGAKLETELKEAFKDTPFVTVKPPSAPIKIGPRS